MANQFYLDNRDIKKLAEFYKQCPKLFQKTSAAVLNKQAFTTRPYMIDQLKKDLDINVPGLLKRETRYQGAKFSDHINQQHSIVGSVRSVDRHDAFEHVATGEPTRATRFFSAGRRGGTGVSLPSARAGKNATKPEDVGVNPDNPREYLQAIARDKTRRRKTFYFPKRYKRMKPGIYKFSGKVGTYQGGNHRIKKTMVGPPVRLSSPRSTIDPAKKPWHVTATKRNMTPAHMKQWWVESFDDQFTRELKRRFGKVSR
ncbi:MAG: hypothetical protein P8X74_03910 [Reinekea sp.]